MSHIQPKVSGRTMFGGFIQTRNPLPVALIVFLSRYEDSRTKLFSFFLKVENKVMLWLYRFIYLLHLYLAFERNFCLSKVSHQLTGKALCPQAQNTNQALKGEWKKKEKKGDQCFKIRKPCSVCRWCLCWILVGLILSS